MRRKHSWIEKLQNQLRKDLSSHRKEVKSVVCFHRKAQRATALLENSSRH